MERESLELLELTASGRPELLPVLAEVLSVAGVGGRVASRWGVEVSALAAATRAAAASLDQLERRRGGRWTAEGISNAGAVLDLATARAGRMVAPSHQHRLERIRRKLADLADHERVRRKLLAFLAEPGRPVKVSRFMPDRRAGPV